MSSTQDPSAIHPEYDRPTPENIDEWTDEQIQAFEEAKESALQDEARTNGPELSDEQRQALDALEDPEKPRTAEVELGEATVTVKTYMNREMEQRVQKIMSSEDDPLSVVDDAIDVLCWIIDDEQYADRRVWEAYHEQYGATQLYLRMTKCLEPVMEEVEQDETVQKFREVGR